MTTRNDGTPERDDAWLDEALALAVPPPVSDTLRARVLRGFAASAPMATAAHPRGVDITRAAVVAAVMVLVVALAAVNPAPQPVAGNGDPLRMAQVTVLEDGNDAARAGLALIDDGPGVTDVRVSLVSPHVGEGAEPSGLLDGLALE